MRFARLFAVVFFILVLVVIASADCRSRTTEQRTVKVKVLKWKTLASGERWTSFFVETPDICNLKTGAPQAYLLICPERLNNCPDALKDMTYEATLIDDEITSIYVDRRAFKVTSVVIWCGWPPPIRWDHIRTKEFDTVECARASDPPKPIASVSTVSPAALPADPATSRSLLAGTTWYERNDWLKADTGAKVVFNAANKATVTLYDKSRIDATWQLQGDEVIIEGPGLRIKATIKGDKMNGVQIPSGPMGHGWTAVRRP